MSDCTEKRSEFLECGDSSLLSFEMVDPALSDAGWRGGIATVWDLPTCPHSHSRL